MSEEFPESNHRANSAKVMLDNIYNVSHRHKFLNKLRALKKLYTLHGEDEDCRMGASCINRDATPGLRA